MALPELVVDKPDGSPNNFGRIVPQQMCASLRHLTQRAESTETIIAMPEVARIFHFTQQVSSFFLDRFTNQFVFF